MLTLEDQLRILNHNPGAWHRPHRFGHEGPRTLPPEPSAPIEGDEPAYRWCDEEMTYVRTAAEGASAMSDTTEKPADPDLDREPVADSPAHHEGVPEAPEEGDLQ